MLKDIYLGEGLFLRNLEIYPILHPEGVIADVIAYPVEEAIERKKIEFKETGDVNRAEVEFRGGMPVEVVEGDEIKGGYQNRIAGQTIYFSGEREVRTHVPVFCVEKLRWHGREIFFKTSGNLAFPSLRSLILKNTMEAFLHRKIGDVVNIIRNLYSYQTIYNIHETQNEVWKKVKNFLCLSGIYSRTEAMSEGYEKQKRNLKDYIQNAQFDSKTCGIMVFIRGKLLGIEIFANNKMFEKFKNKILQSYLIEGNTFALTPYEAENLPDVKPSNLAELLGKMFKRRVNTVEAVDGASEFYRQDRLTMRVLKHKDKLLHLSLLPEIK